MRAHCLALTVGLTIAGWAQPAEPVIFGGTSTAGAPGGVGVSFQLDADGPASGLGGRFGGTFRMSSGDHFTFVTRYIYDSSRHVYLVTTSCWRNSRPTRTW